MRLATRPALRRLVLIDAQLRSGRYPTARSLARDLEAHLRTIRRDLEFLRDSLKAPLAFCPRRKGYYYTDPTFTLPAARLTESELVALFLAERLLQQYRGTPYAAHLANLFHKLTAGLAAEVTIDLAHLADTFSVRGPAPRAADAGLFAQLARAIRDARQLEILYWSASRDETRRRVVDPYHLASLQGDWYLLAYCHLRGDMRMFAPGRIRELGETGAHFDRPADFRFAEYLDAGFRAMHGTGPPQQARLRFTPPAARYVREKIWHPTQSLEDLPDGSLEMTLRVNHLLEVRRWVLSYGPDCEVLEPDQLRVEVIDELKRTLAVYAPRPSNGQSPHPPV
jgi:predicted DNA-binding transcriptional regulator YafY